MVLARGSHSLYPTVRANSSIFDRDSRACAVIQKSNRKVILLTEARLEAHRLTDIRAARVRLANEPRAELLSTVLLPMCHEIYFQGQDMRRPGR